MYQFLARHGVNLTINTNEDMLQTSKVIFLPSMVISTSESSNDLFYGYNKIYYFYKRVQCEHYNINGQLNILLVILKNTILTTHFVTYLNLTILNIKFQNKN